MNPAFQNYLLQVTKASTCEEIEVIQSLWSGYGSISRYELEGSLHRTVVVKSISLNQVAEHPRGWNTDKSHTRKVKSYEVETHWYEQWNQQCTEDCRTPEFIGSYTEGKDQWIVLEDLDANYPLRKQQLEIGEVKACLKWLANFHAKFLGQKPNGLWEVGTYWHLETRPDELEKTEHLELKSKAHGIDKILNSCTYQTFVQGDAKLANFCFSDNGDVAMVDFQYVGGGCGMKDVAYFLGSCISSQELEQYEMELLDFYFTELKFQVGASIEFATLEEEWRRLYPVAVADFIRFLLGWMPTHQKVNAYSLKLTNSVLENL
jgi:hypothetical protein